MADIELSLLCEMGGEHGISGGYGHAEHHGDAAGHDHVDQQHGNADGVEPEESDGALQHQEWDEHGRGRQRHGDREHRGKLHGNGDCGQMRGHVE